MVTCAFETGDFKHHGREESEGHNATTLEEGESEGINTGIIKVMQALTEGVFAMKYLGYETLGTVYET